MSLSSFNTLISSPATSKSLKKRRRVITNTEKIELRSYFFDKTYNKRPTLNVLQRWYHDKHPHLPISTSSLDEITSSKYDCLDVLNITQTVSEGYTRLRNVNYPDLEVVLY